MIRKEIYFLYDFTYEKGMHAHKYLHSFTIQSPVLMWEKNVMNVLDTKILHELEYSVYVEKKKIVSKELRGDDRIIRYEFVVSCPKIYGTL